jgi:short subunit fatty acids transporter
MSSLAILGRHKTVITICQLEHQGGRSHAILRLLITYLSERTWSLYRFCLPMSLLIVIGQFVLNAHPAGQSILQLRCTPPHQSCQELTPYSTGTCVAW